MYDLEEDGNDIDIRRVLDVDTAIKNNVSKTEIKLYEQLSIAMELMDGNFRIADSGIKKDRVHFDIATPYPDGLPESLALMFFDVDINYLVQINESNCVNDLDNRHFTINLIKH
jgi:hypothetical protein